LFGINIVNEKISDAEYLDRKKKLRLYFEALSLSMRLQEIKASPSLIEKSWGRTFRRMGIKNGYR